MAEWLARPKDLPLMSLRSAHRVRNQRPSEVDCHHFATLPTTRACSKMRQKGLTYRAYLAGAAGIFRSAVIGSLDLSSLRLEPAMPTATPQPNPAAIPQTGVAARRAIRNGEWSGPTSGMAPGYV